MHSLIKKLLYTICYLFCTISSIASEQYTYNILSNKDWLTSSANSIYKRGGEYVWIGTNRGIYRFDGHNFKHYLSTNNDSVINGEITYKITADKKGQIWALSKKGLSKYNAEEDLFQLLTDTLLQSSFFSSCETEKGIYFGGINKLYYHHYQSGETKPIYQFKGDNQTGNITDLFMLSANEIVLNAHKDIIIFNLIDKTFSRISTPSVISCLYVDHHQQIWVGSYESGLVCYSRKGKIIGEYNTRTAQLSNNAVLCIESKDSLLWIGTDGGGINIINPHTQKRVYTLQHIAGEQNSFPANSIKGLYKDQNNTIWASSVRNGIIGIRKSHIKSYIESSFHSKYGLSNSTVLAIYQEPNTNAIWIGTDGEGINQMDLQTREFKAYPTTRNTKVTSITDFNRKYLLLSIYLQGLYLFDKQTGNLLPFHYLENIPNTAFLHGRTSTNVYHEEKDNILFLTDHIYRYNKKYNQLRELSFSSTKGYGNIFIAGRFGNALYLYDTYQLYCLENQSTTVNTLTSVPQAQTINAATITPQGNIWIATNKGIMIYNIEKNQFKQKTNKLIHHLSTIVSDTKGNIWIGEGDKLYSYLQDSKDFALFGKSDGVIANEYIKNSHCVTTQGDVILGGTKGMLVIDNHFKLKKFEKPTLSLNEIKIDGEELPISAIKETLTIDIPANSKTVELNFSTIENDILRPKAYRYEIKGVKDYNYESYSSTVKLTSLTPGLCHIYVSGKAKDGQWTTPTLLLSIHMPQVWYKTLWFKITLILSLLALAGWGMKLLYLRKKRMLDKELKEKERLINEEKINYLININHELRTPLTLIYGPLKKVIQRTNPSSHNYPPLNKIMRQTERMKELLNMVLDLRKMEEGESSVHIEEVNVNQWIHKIVEDFADEEDPTAIKFKTNLSPDITTVKLDIKKCEIILTNLLVNAIKHSTANDTVLIQSSICDEQYLTISVIDQGVGLKGVDISQLFTRFYQGDHEQIGTGIGLSYAKLLVELQGGSIGALNNAEKGATFYFKIPLNLPTGSYPCQSKAYLNEIFSSEENKYSAGLITTEPSYHTAEKCILMVDDNKELIEFTCESLNGKFKKILTAYNGNEAIRCLQEEQVDIIVSDIMMPEMDGYKLCQQVKSNILYSHIPVILLTARTDESSKKLGYKMGADGYIAKPFDIELLHELIISQLKTRDIIKQKYLRLTGTTEPVADTFSQVDEKFLLQLNQIIKENIGNSQLDIPFICQEIGMSRASLYNKLKAITGISCNEYINKIRMDYAIALVKNTHKSFIEIADETGFANSRYFSTSFKQHTGKTPTQFRKEFQEQ